MRIENGQNLRIDDIKILTCQICGNNLEFGKYFDEYLTICCDRSYRVIPKIFETICIKITPDNVDKELELNTLDEEIDDIDE